MRKVCPVKLLPILLLTLIPSLSFAQRGVRHMPASQVSQPLTRSSPTLASEGMSLQYVTGFRVTVCATVGNTLSGAGTLHAYLYNSENGLWARNPTLDHAVNVTATSCNGAPCRCQSFPDQEVMIGSGGRVLYAASGVTVSAGTTVDVYVDGDMR